jgi:hypothetical protein
MSGNFFEGPVYTLYNQKPKVDIALNYFDKRKINIWSKLLSISGEFESFSLREKSLKHLHENMTMLIIKSERNPYNVVLLLLINFCYELKKASLLVKSCSTQDFLFLGLELML